MDKTDVDKWLQDYVDAWKTFDRAKIEGLFADDVDYRYHPYDEPVRGRASVARSWLGEGEHAGASTPDEPGTFDANYRCIAVDGDVAVAVGESIYLTERGGEVDRIYDNCYVMRFDGAGRCREFTEWYMQRPKR